MAYRTPKSPRPRKVKPAQRTVAPKSVTPIQVAAAAFAMRSVKRSGAETQAHRNERVATPILGPGWSRRRLKQHLPDKYGPCPCGSEKRFNLCCWKTEYGAL